MTPPRLPDVRQSGENIPGMTQTDWGFAIVEGVFTRSEMARVLERAEARSYQRDVA